MLLSHMKTSQVTVPASGLAEINDKIAGRLSDAEKLCAVLVLISNLYCAAEFIHRPYPLTTARQCN